ncbi:MAG: hypothetical protein PHY35_02980 [Candidatus Omnitrophica bacterium]|nr:hypothetical protein [Candidatus Omnitrophota bacterium]
MKKTEILTGLFVLLIATTGWAGDSVTIAMSCTIPSIPGVNAPANVPEAMVRGQIRQDVAKNNSTATEGAEYIEKEERLENLLAQGEKVTRDVRTVYLR